LLTYKEKLSGLFKDFCIYIAYSMIFYLIKNLAPERALKIIKKIKKIRKIISSL
jgi:hypothetical protein